MNSWISTTWPYAESDDSLALHVFGLDLNLRKLAIGDEIFFRIAKEYSGTKVRRYLKDSCTGTVKVMTGHGGITHRAFVAEAPRPSRLPQPEWCVLYDFEGLSKFADVVRCDNHSKGLVTHKELSGWFGYTVGLGFALRKFKSGESRILEHIRSRFLGAE